MGLLLAIAFGGSGCHDTAEPLTGPQAPLLNAAVTGRAVTIDDALRQIGDMVPGFGGLYVNEADELVIRLRDSSVLAVGREAVLRVLGRIPGRRGAPVRAQPATFTFAELQEWMRRILRSVSPAGVLVADIDERDNRLFIGVEDLGVASRVEAEVERLGIPAGAVGIHTVTPHQKLSANDSLTSVSTPVVGGVMVQVVNFPQGGAKPHCTAGFNAWLLPDTVQLYLVINDHCTWQMGGVTGDTLWQSNWAGPGSRPIAIEVASAQYRTLPDSVCFGYAQCRYSDAALFRYINSSDGLLGSIARPLDFSHGSVPFTLVRDTADFLITGDLPRNRLTVQGEWMSKIGVTTGWSVGKVDATCILALEAPGKYAVCQFTVNDVTGVGSAFVDGGDSGAPAVRTVWSEDDVYAGTNWLAGILHSGGPAPGGSYGFTASDINLLYLDLGAMKTYRGPTCIPDPYYWSCQ